MITTRIEINGRIYFPFKLEINEGNYHEVGGSIYIATRTLDAIAITTLDIDDFFYEKFTCGNNFDEYFAYINRTNNFDTSEDNVMIAKEFITAIIKKHDGSLLAEVLNSDLSITYRPIFDDLSRKYDYCVVLDEDYSNPKVLKEDDTVTIGNYKYTLHSGNCALLGWMVDIVDIDKFDPSETIKSNVHGLPVNFVNYSFGEIKQSTLKIPFSQYTEKMEMQCCEFNSTVKVLDMTHVRFTNLAQVVGDIFNNNNDNISVMISKEAYEHHSEDFIHSGFMFRDLIVNFDTFNTADINEIMKINAKKNMLGIKTYSRRLLVV